MPSLNCPNCGGSVELPPSCDFLSCGFCGSTLFADTLGTVPCLYAPARTDAGQMVSYIRRFLSEYELRSPVEMSGLRGMYLPFWRLSKGTRTLERAAFASPGEGLLAFRPAAAARFENLTEEKRLAQSMDWLAPELPVEAMMAEWTRLHQEEPEGVQAALRYLPAFTVDYEYEGRPYRATVDGLSGAVLPEEIPPSPMLALDRRTLGWSAALAGAYLAEGTFLPGLWMPALAYGATALAAYPLLRKALLGGNRD